MKKINILLSAFLAVIVPLVFINKACCIPYSDDEYEYEESEGNDESEEESEEEQEEEQEEESEDEDSEAEHERARELLANDPFNVCGD